MSYGRTVGGASAAWVAAVVSVWLLPACSGGSGGPGGVDTGPFEFDFETGLEGWGVDATDVERPGGAPGEEIRWEIELSDERSYTGNTSVVMWMENFTDAGKVWIERPFALKPSTTYTADISFQFASDTEGEIGTWQIIAGALGYDPEVGDDLFDNGAMPGDDTFNGGVAGYVWLDKHYSDEVVTDSAGRAWVVIGIWGTFEVLRTHYVDSVRISFSEH